MLSCVYPFSSLISFSLCLSISLYIHSPPFGFNYSIILLNFISIGNKISFGNIAYGNMLCYNLVKIFPKVIFL